MNSLDQGFQVEELRVDPQSGEVTGPAGREKLDRKVMDVLLHMARHAGQVVSREDLLAALWPGAVVSDDALTRCFYELRRHLSRVGGDDSYRALVETHPKRGYRLAGTVVPLAPATGDQPVAPRKRKRLPTWAVATGAAVLLAIIGTLIFTQFLPTQPVATVTAPKNSIAVLPFVDMSAEKDQAFFSDGVTEEILNRLSQSENLTVIARTSSFAFRNEQIDVPEIGKRLNVAYVLEGSVRKAADRVRITAQLIDVATNAHAWSKTYDRAIDDLFAVQDEIAESVAMALQVTLAGGRQLGRVSENVAAYERFLQGQFFYNRRAPGDIDRAVTHYKDGIALDPGFARAWASLAAAYALLAADNPDRETTYRELQGEAAHKAVELDPQLSIAHSRLSQYYFRVGQMTKAREHRDRAEALDPDDLMVNASAGTRAIWRGDFGEAVARWRRIVQMDPLNPTERKNLANMLLMNGQLDEALAENRKVLEIHPAAGSEVECEIARILILLGRYDESQSVVAQMTPGKDRDYVLALQYEAPGRQAEADAALKRLTSEARDTRDTVRLADIYASRGMFDEAFALLQSTREALDQAMPRRAGLQWDFQQDIRVSPFLKTLHADPRWSAVAALPAAQS